MYFFQKKCIKFTKVHSKENKTRFYDRLPVLILLLKMFWEKTISCTAQKDSLWLFALYNKNSCKKKKIIYFCFIRLSLTASSIKRFVHTVTYSKICINLRLPFFTTYYILVQTFPVPLPSPCNEAKSLRRPGCHYLHGDG